MIEKGKKNMRLFITKKKLVKKLAEEVAYLQINADWWYYCFCDGKESDYVVDKDAGITVQDMSSSELELVTEVKAIAMELGIWSEVYKEAIKIYDFKNSGKKGHIADVELIKKLHKEFCEPKKKKRPFM